MSNRIHQHLFVIAAVVLTASAAFAQNNTEVRVRQLPGWDARAREGHCNVRVWVDNRAEVRLRGESIFVNAMEGARGRDEGSECSQPLPYNSVRDFQIRQTAGRSRITLAQDPSRMNNYTAMIAINDTQGGGDTYAFEVTWHADMNLATASAPFFDDVHACQDVVRQRFQAQNGRGSYLDFTGFADRRGGQEQGQVANRDHGSDRNRGQESIQGRGNARRSNESREFTYSCVIDTRQNQVLSGSYQYVGDALRGHGREDDHRPLK